MALSAAVQPVSIGPQSCLGNTLEVTPMSSISASETWCLTLALPFRLPTEATDDTHLAVFGIEKDDVSDALEMPSLLQSDGSDLAMISPSGIASSRPMPIIGRARRTE